MATVAQAPIFLRLHLVAVATGSHTVQRARSLTAVPDAKTFTTCEFVGVLRDHFDHQLIENNGVW